MTNSNFSNQFSVLFLNSTNKNQSNFIIIKYSANINWYEENKRENICLSKIVRLPKNLLFNIDILKNNNVTKNIAIRYIKQDLKSRFRDKNDVYQNIQIIKIEYHLNYVYHYSRIEYYDNYFSYNFNYKESILNATTINFLDNLEQEKNYIYLLKVDSIANLFILGGLEYFYSEIVLDRKSRIINNHKSARYAKVIKHIEDNLYSYNVDILKCERITIYKITPQDINFLYNLVHDNHDDTACININYHHYNRIEIGYRDPDLPDD